VNRPLRFSLSRDAQRDLMELYAYFEARGDALVGRGLIKALFMKIEALASSGHSGVPRDWISPGLRAFPHKNRCIYFRVFEGQMRVLRILHGRQDVKREMFSPNAED
jgi:plasmid stabilization system protein ParE